MRMIEPFVAITVCVALQTNVSLAVDYVDQVERDRPVAHWRFEDSSGKDNDPAKDTTGNHAGAYRGGVTLVDGVPGIGSRAATSLDGH